VKRKAKIMIKEVKVFERVGIWKKLNTCKDEPLAFGLHIQ
jgi:hypothetical protein